MFKAIKISSFSSLSLVYSTIHQWQSRFVISSYRQILITLLQPIKTQNAQLNGKVKITYKRVHFVADRMHLSKLEQHSNCCRFDDDDDNAYLLFCELINLKSYVVSTNNVKFEKNST